MKKKDIKKEGYKRIIRNNESHQEVYNSLTTPISAKNLIIAKELSRIPSKSVVENFKTLRLIYIILLCIFLMLKLLGVFILSQSYNTNTTILIIGIIFGVFAPGLGIYGILTQKLELCKSVSILLSIYILRSLDKIELNIETAFVFTLTIAIIALGFIINSKMITAYKKTIFYKDGDKRNVSFNIEFDNTNLSSSNEILDDF
jgi:hypothetical protein